VIKISEYAEKVLREKIPGFTFINFRILEAEFSYNIDFSFAMGALIRIDPRELL